MDFLLKSKSYFFNFDEQEEEFLNKIFLYMDKTPVEKTNFKSFVYFIKTDINIIKSTEEKLNKFIEKYNFSKIVESFIDIFTKGFTESAQKESAQKESAHKYSLQPLKKKEKYQVYKGGSEALSKLSRSTIPPNVSFVWLIFLAIMLIVLFIMLELEHSGRRKHSGRRNDMYHEDYVDYSDYVDYFFEKLMFLYYRFRYLILKKRIDIETLEIIGLPGIEATQYNEFYVFYDDLPRAELIPIDREEQLRRNRNILLAEYDRSQHYIIYSRLTRRERNQLLEQINRIDNELASLLQPHFVLENVQNLARRDVRSLPNVYYDARNDIVADPVPATDETKNIFKFILRYCLGFINRIPYDYDDYDDMIILNDGQSNSVPIRNIIPSNNQIVDQRPIFINRIPSDSQIVNEPRRRSEKGSRRRGRGGGTGRRKKKRSNTYKIKS
jgi:hypothetical protein